MTTNTPTLETLIAKEEIRQLALLYSRGVDRQDAQLLHDLYTDDATDTHGDTFDGSGADFVNYLQSTFPYMAYGGHHICNHLISVDGNEGEGEIYAIAYHIIPDGEGGWLEDMMCVRYLDRYRKEDDGQWRFAKRVVTYDLASRRPVAAPTNTESPGSADTSYQVLQSRLFARGARG